jgi:hypothetical protein
LSDASDQASAFKLEGDPPVRAGPAAVEAGGLRFIVGLAGVDDLGVLGVAFRANHKAIALADQER